VSVLLFVLIAMFLAACVCCSILFFGASCLQKAGFRMLGWNIPLKLLLLSGAAFVAPVLTALLYAWISRPAFIGLCFFEVFVSWFGFWLFVRDEQRHRVSIAKAGIVIVSANTRWLLGTILGMVFCILISHASYDVLVMAKYAGAYSSVSALRTKIKVHQAEEGRLPGLEYEGFVQFLSGSSPFQQDLDIADGGWGGAYFDQDDFQYYVEQPSSNVWIYCVAVSGDGTGKSPPKGTAYAVLEINNPAWGKKSRVVAVFERYRLDSNFGSNDPLMIRAFDSVDISDDARANCIPIPTWSVVSGELTTATGEFDVEALERNFGFSVN